MSTMEIYKAEELVTMIKEVDERISEVLMAKDYELDTGQSRQRVKRESIDELRKYRADLVAQLSVLQEGAVTQIL